MSRSTTFFRLLAADDKAAACRNVISAIGAGLPVRDVYTADPESFHQVPRSPFAYWVGAQVRQVFGSYAQFECSMRIVRQGLATKDNTRFVRTWWEIAANSIISGIASSSHADFEKSTYQGKIWASFAKGGQFSTFYDDPHLAIDWEREGERLKAWITADAGYHWSRNVASRGHYFRPGLTYPRRTQAGFNVRAMPAGCIFADKGPAMFVLGDVGPDLLMLLAVVNSAPFTTLLSLQMAFGSYEVGVVQRTPVPEHSVDDVQTLTGLAREAHDLKRDADRDDEVTHPFTVPALVRLGARATLAEAMTGLAGEGMVRERRLAAIQREIDDRCFALYGFSAEDRAQVEREDATPESGEPAEDEDSDENVGAAGDAGQVEYRETANLVRYAVGCAFGRWDIRIGRVLPLAPKLADPFAPLPVCAPGTLVDTDGLPATPGHIVSEEWLRARPDAITLPPAGSVQRPTIADDEYLIRIAWDGILVDDPEHPADIVGRVREALAVLWPGENGARAGAIEREACEILGVREWRDYFRKPAGFFEDHLKRYSKSRRQAPIYWPLSTASGSYTLWVYYHRLTSDTLYTAVNRYVEPKLAEVRRRLADDERELEGGASGRDGSRLRASAEQGQAFLRELQEFRDELLRVAALPYQPNLNDGVIITAAPLHRLFRLPRWARDTKATWEKLERGDYDWAHLAYTLWPERVREKCRTDKSLAIAHGLEELYVEPPATAKKGRGRKAAAEEVELIEVGDDGQE